LEDRAREVVSRSAALGGQLHPVTLDSVVELLQEAFLRGQISPGEIIRVSGLAERTGRVLLGQLLKERLLVSDSPKGAVRFGIPTQVAGYLFPNIYPGLPTE
jgi:hypothetical protein